MPKKNIYKNIHNNYTKYILEVAKETFPEVRKRKYSLEYYLNKFIIVYSKLTKWEDLDNYCDPNSSENHWNTINNEFRKWCKFNIFEIAYNRLLTKGYYKLRYIKKSKTMNLFIDVTKINNNLGTDNVGINCEYKKKNVTGLQFIVDEYKIPLSVRPLELNNIKGTEYKNNINKNNINNNKIINNIRNTEYKNNINNNKTKNNKIKKIVMKETKNVKQLNDTHIKYKTSYENNKIITTKIIEKVVKIENYDNSSENMKNIIIANDTINKNTKVGNIVRRSTLQHEIKNVQKTLNSIDIKLKPYNKIKLVGDKAYICKEEFTIFNKKIRIITPKRKNDKTKQKKRDLKVLKKRSIVENYFISLKIRSKVKDRKERKIENYMGFVYLDMFIYFSKILGRNKIEL